MPVTLPTQEQLKVIQAMQELKKLGKISSDLSFQEQYLATQAMLQAAARQQNGQTQPPASPQLYMLPTDEGMKTALVNPQDVASFQQQQATNQPPAQEGGLLAALDSPAAKIATNSAFFSTELLKRQGFGFKDILKGVPSDPVKYAAFHGTLPGGLAAGETAVLEAGASKGFLNGLKIFGKGAGKFMPGAVNVGLSAIDEFQNGYEAIKTSDGKGLTKSVLRVAGGAGGAWAGAGTGAAISTALTVAFPPAGAVSWAITGICCAVGAWLGSKGSGEIADAVVGDSNAEKTQKDQQLLIEQKARGPQAIDPALAQSMLDGENRLRYAQQLASRQGVSFNGTTVNTAVGAVNTGTGSVNSPVALQVTRSSLMV